MPELHLCSLPRARQTHPTKFTDTLAADRVRTVAHAADGLSDHLRNGVQQGSARYDQETGLKRTLPTVIPPRSVFRCVRGYKRTPLPKMQVGRMFRIGYYSRQD